MRKEHVKVFLVSAMTAATVALAGCNSVDSASDPEISVPLSEAGDTESSESRGSTPESAPEHKLSDEEMKLVSELQLKSFTGPDGSEMKFEDADYVFDSRKDFIEMGSPGFKFKESVFTDDYTAGDDESGDPFIYTVLSYNFAYMRYARPFYYSGETPDRETREQMLGELPPIKWFKVKAGDKLDCGLTVKKAVYERLPVQTSFPTRDNYIEFDGEITLEGLLFTAQNNRDYLTQPGDLVFSPDPTKTSGLPVSNAQFEDDNDIYYTMGSGGEYVMTDIGSYGWQIGKVDEIDSDAIFGDDEVVTVKVTLKNVRYGGIYTYDMPSIYAEIVDIDRIDQ